jgi:Uma2 family endonuclease
MMIPVEEYLHTVYKPDVDYVDGEILERHWGEVSHGLAQAAVGAYLHSRRKGWNITVLFSPRIQVARNRFRIPDLCVLLGAPNEQILTKAPFLCIEILSPEDRWSRVNARIEDFLAMGVPFVWVIDPEARKAYTVTSAQGMHEVTDGVLRTSNPSFDLPLTEIFE